MISSDEWPLVTSGFGWAEVTRETHQNVRIGSRTLPKPLLLCGPIGVLWPSGILWHLAWCDSALTPIVFDHLVREFVISGWCWLC
jgi:hypothetical protein